MENATSVVSSSRGVVVSVTGNGVEAPEGDARECSRLKKRDESGQCTTSAVPDSHSLH